MLDFLKVKFPKPKRLLEDQLAEARLQALQHEANAEYSAAMAAMYRARIERLQQHAKDL